MQRKIESAIKFEVKSLEVFRPGRLPGLIVENENMAFIAVDAEPTLSSKGGPYWLNIDRINYFKESPNNGTRVYLAGDKTVDLLGTPHSLALAISKIPKDN